MRVSPWNDKQLFSGTDGAGSEEWATPSVLFDAIDGEFGFDLDAAASEQNRKVDNYLSKKDDALTSEWGGRGSVVWLNPPYGRTIKAWLRKAYEESLGGLTVVVLTFARTETVWWHEYATKAAEVRFVRGRIHFVRDDGHSGPATAPSAILVYDEKRRRPHISHVELPRGNKGAVG